MTDKVQKISEEVKRLMYGYNLEADIASCEDAETEKLANIKYQLCKKILEYIDTLQKETVSEDLEEAVKNRDEYKEWQGFPDIQKELIDFAKFGNQYKELAIEDLGDYINELSKQFPEVSFAKLSRIAVRVAKWQEKQDQSTIELAEDHAMLAGMNKMEQQMMAKAKSGTVQKDNQVILDDGTYIDLDPSMQLKPSFVGLKEGDRIKVIVIKK